MDSGGLPRASLASLVSVFSLATLAACGPRRPPGTPLREATRDLPTAPVATFEAEESTAPTESLPTDVIALPAPVDEPEPAVDPILAAAERAARPGGRAVLVAAREMISEGVIVRGSCWDFVSVVYKRAAPHLRAKTIFSSSKKGPYASRSLLEPGDWLYLLHPTGGEHSVIFVQWESPGSKIALIADYVGAKRAKPGRYWYEDTSRVYNVMRLVAE